jgi:uncharacterized phage protein gp47/JayE
MPDLPTRADLLAIGRDYVVQRATRIDPNRVDVLGSDVNLFIGSQSVVGFQLVKQLAYRTNALLLDGASGPDMDRYAWDRYQLPRKGAVGARATVRFFRASSALGAGVIPLGTTLRTLTGIDYVTTTSASFGPGTLDGVTAFVRASQAGKATQVGANQIRQFANVQALFDPTLQVNNDAKSAGGEDAEDDDDFRNRIRNFWLTARRGILAAIEFGALAVPGVVSAQAVEALNGLAQPARIVNLYIADSSGVASDALANDVLASLDDFRAAGIAVLISNSLPQIVPIQLALTFAGGTDTVTLAQNIQAAVVEFVNSLPVNGPLYVAQLFSVLQRFNSDGLVPNASTIIAPAGDLIPSLGSTLRTTLDNVSVTTV